MISTAASGLYGSKRHNDTNHCISHAKALSARVPLRWDEIKIGRAHYRYYERASSSLWIILCIGADRDIDQAVNKLEFHIATNPAPIT